MADPRYVERDKDKNIIAHYACPQKWANEELPADHPDILAYYEKRKAVEKEARDKATEEKNRIPFLENKIRELEEQINEIRTGKQTENK